MDCAESDVSMLNKKDQVGKLLQEREDERIKAVNKRKEEAEKTASKSEKTHVFMETLTSGVASIKEGLAKASHQDKDSLPAYFDNLSYQLAEIQKYVTDSAMFLSSYDLAQKQQQLNDLQAEIVSSRNNLLPKGKFAFKNRKKRTDSPAAPAPSVVSGGCEEESAKKTSASAVDLLANEYRVTDMVNQVTRISSEDVYNKDLVISALTGSTLEVTGAPSVMHLTDVADSSIISGPCARSIFIEKCSNCVLVLACQQLRIHEAVNCTFFIHVTSKAIIEDSNGLKFAPYKLSYDGIADHYKASGLNQQINNWYDVDDFNWLVKDKQSPNWSILPEKERITHQIE